MNFSPALTRSRRPRRQSRQSERIEIRIQARRSISPKLFASIQAAKHLTVLVRLEEFPGTLLGDILKAACKLESITIYRKDDDWDAQNTYLIWNDDKKLAEGLRNHPTLKKFSLTGFDMGCPLAEISRALLTVPHLSCLKLAAQPPPTAIHNNIDPSLLYQTMPPEALQQMLARKSITHLSLLGLLPESLVYTRVLEDAYVQNKCQTHIYVHFANNNDSAKRFSPPTRFSYYLREIMELNQKGRAEVGSDSSKLLRLLKHCDDSLDGVYVLLRENPWLCRNTNSRRNDSKRHGRRGVFLSKLRRLRLYGNKLK